MTQATAAAPPPEPADPQIADFGDFDRRYRRYLVAYVRWAYPDADAEDIAQEVLLRAYTSFADPSAIERPERWIRVVAQRIVIDQVRRRPPSRELALDLALEQDLAHSERGPADAAAGREEIQWLAEVLNTAPLAERLLVRTMLRDGATCAEAARTLGISPAAARQQVHRFRTRVVTAFAEHGYRLSLASLTWWILRRRKVRGHQAATTLTTSTAAFAIATSVFGAVVTFGHGSTNSSRPTLDTGNSPGHARLLPADSSSALSTRSAAEMRQPTPMYRASSTPDTPIAHVSTSDHPLDKGQTFSVVVWVPTPLATINAHVVDDKSGAVCETVPNECK
jgi:RNA polymerase sigma factor (sigma-70 family)